MQWSDRVGRRLKLRDLHILLTVARSGSMGLAASGRFGLADGNMDLRLATKLNVATDRPLQAADMSGSEVISLRGPWHEPFVRLEEEATPPR